MESSQSINEWQELPTQVGSITVMMAILFVFFWREGSDIKTQTDDDSQSESGEKREA